MTAPANVERRTSRRLVPAALLVLAGCGALRLSVEPPAPDVRREHVELGATRCRSQRCRSDVTVGTRRYRVETATRVVSVDEASGRPAPSAGRRAAGAIGGAIARGIGIATSQVVVGLGTRIVTDTAARMALHCDLAWIDEDTRAREGGETVTTSARRAEGIACHATRLGDDARRWSFRRGIPVAGDSLVAVLDSLDVDGSPAGDVPGPVIERWNDGDANRRSVYVILRDTVRTRSRWIPVDHWRIHRVGGALVGTIFESPVPPRFIDIAEVADDEETAVLRLVSAVLAEPIRGG